MYDIFAVIAQAVERNIGSVEVTGPTPVSSLMKKLVNTRVSEFEANKKNTPLWGVFLRLGFIWGLQCVKLNIS